MEDKLQFGVKDTLGRTESKILQERRSQGYFRKDGVKEFEGWS